MEKIYKFKFFNNSWKNIAGQSIWFPVCWGELFKRRFSLIFFLFPLILPLVKSSLIYIRNRQLINISLFYKKFEYFFRLNSRWSLPMRPFFPFFPFFSSLTLYFLCKRIKLLSNDSFGFGRQFLTSEFLITESEGMKVAHAVPCANQFSIHSAQVPCDFPRMWRLFDFSLDLQHPRQHPEEVTNHHVLSHVTYSNTH